MAPVHVRGGARPAHRWGPGIGADDVRHLEPLATQTLTEDELQRAANLGRNGSRDVAGLTMTHFVPNEHVAVTR